MRLDVMVVGVDRPDVGAEIDSGGPAIDIGEGAPQRPVPQALGAVGLGGREAVVPPRPLRQRIESPARERHTDRQQPARRDVVVHRPSEVGRGADQVRAPRVGHAAAQVGADPAQGVAQERIRAVAPHPLVADRPRAQRAPGLARFRLGAGAHDVVPGGEARLRGVVVVVQVDRHDDPGALEEAMEVDPGAERDRARRVPRPAALPDRDEVRAPPVEPQVEAHQVGQRALYIQPPGLVDVLRDVGRPDLVEPQRAPRVAARAVGVDEADRDAPQPRERRPALDDVLGRAVGAGAEDRRVALGVAELQVRQVGELDRARLPGDLEGPPARRAPRQRGVDLVVVATDLVRREAHEVAQAVARDVLGQVEAGGEPLEAPVPAVVLVEREGLECLQAVAGLELGELERDGLLAPRDLLVAAQRLPGVERGAVVVRVVQAVDGVERQGRARAPHLARQVGGLPAAADDV